MIAYFDTSAVVPLIVREPSSALCSRLWDESARIVSVRLLYPEARAALARSWRQVRADLAAAAVAVGLPVAMTSS